MLRINRPILRRDRRASPHGEILESLISRKLVTLFDVSTEKDCFLKSAGFVEGVFNLLVDDVTAGNFARHLQFSIQDNVLTSRVGDERVVEDVTIAKLVRRA